MSEERRVELDPQHFANTYRRHCELSSAQLVQEIFSVRRSPSEQNSIDTEVYLDVGLKMAAEDGTSENDVSASAAPGTPHAPQHQNAWALMRNPRRGIGLGAKKEGRNGSLYGSFFTDPSTVRGAASCVWIWSCDILSERQSQDGLPISPIARVPGHSHIAAST